MKKLILIALMCALCLSACGEKDESDTETKNDTAATTSIGSEAVTEDSGEADKKGDETKPIFDVVGESFLPRYDSNGRIIKKMFTGFSDYYSEVQYGSDGKITTESYYSNENTLVGVYKYEYDANGNPSKLIAYDSDNNALGQFLFTCDESGNIVKGEFTAPDNTPMGWIEYKCDANGNIIALTSYNSENVKESTRECTGNTEKATYYNEDGSVENSVENKYDNNGKPVTTTWYWGNGSINFCTEYDTNGNMVKSTDYDSEGNVTGWDKYEYDADGNKIKGTRYNSDGSVNNVTEYDAYGNIIKKTRYDADGNVIEEY